MSSKQTAACRIAIIGGGISGLSAAHRLGELARERSLNLQVTLIESNDRLGGVISTIRKEDLIIEQGPDSFITQKPWALSLCKRLGIEDKVIATSSKNRGLYVVNNGRLVAVPEGFLMMAPTNWWSFVNSPLFSLPGKMRMAMDLFLPRGEQVPDESLSHFVTRRLGREALDRVAQPLISGIYTADPEKLSLRATMPRFLDLEQKYGSVIRGLYTERQRGDNGTAQSTGARYTLFASLDQGLQVLVDKLSREIRDFKLSRRVSAMSLTAGRKWLLEMDNGEKLESDLVILATPVNQAANLLSGAAPDLSRKLASISAASSAVLNLLYNRKDVPHKLDAFGFVVPAAEHRSILACTFSSIKFTNRCSEDKLLVRVFLGGAMHPEIYQRSDAEMIAAARKDLKELLGISVEPELADLTRFPDSMPQYDVGHTKLVDEIDALAAKLPGLALAGNAYHGVGIPDCIRSGEQAAETLVTQISQQVENG